MSGMRTTTQTKTYKLKDGTVKTYDSNVTYFVKNTKNRKVVLKHTPEQIQQIINIYNEIKYPSPKRVYDILILNCDFEITYGYVVKYINNYKKTI